jgi:hypothetical protein
MSPHPRNAFDLKKSWPKTGPKPSLPAVRPAAPQRHRCHDEVAHLSLAAIVARFPDELKLLLPPADAGRAALPTILQLLPTGW